LIESVGGCDRTSEKRNITRTEGKEEPKERTHPKKKGSRSEEEKGLIESMITHPTSTVLRRGSVGDNALEMKENGCQGGGGLKRR